jgi:hypothetical protein
MTELPDHAELGYFGASSQLLGGAPEPEVRSAPYGHRDEADAGRLTAAKSESAVDRGGARVETNVYGPDGQRLIRNAGATVTLNLAGVMWEGSTYALGGMFAGRASAESW